MPLSQDPDARARQLANLRQGGQSPPAMRVEHGGYATLAAKQVEAKAAELIAALGKDLPLRDDDGQVPAADALVLRMLAEALLRLDSVTEYLTRRGIEDDAGNLRPAIEVERRLRGEVGDYCAALGLTPRSRAALGVDLVTAKSVASKFARRQLQPDDAAELARLRVHAGQLADVEATALPAGDP